MVIKTLITVTVLRWEDRRSYLLKGRSDQNTKQNIRHLFVNGSKLEWNSKKEGEIEGNTKIKLNSN